LFANGVSQKIKIATKGRMDAAINSVTMNPELGAKTALLSMQLMKSNM
jgi:hypothetical protein